MLNIVSTQERKERKKIILRKVGSKKGREN